MINALDFFMNYNFFLVKKVFQSFQPIVIPPKRNPTPNKYSLLISWYIPNPKHKNDITNEAINKDFTFFIIS